MENRAEISEKEQVWKTARRYRNKRQVWKKPGKDSREMGRKRITAGIICLIFLLAAGCSERGGETRSPAPSQSGGNTQEHAEKEKTRKKELRQAVKPQFIPNGIRGVSLKKEGREFLYIAREPADHKMDFDYWEILKPYGENATMDTEVMYEMFKELCSLTFTEPVQVEEGTDTGIQDSDMGIVIEYVDTMDDTQAKSAEEADTEAEIILGKVDGKGGRYAALAGSMEEVFVLPEDTLQMIYARKPFDYILKIPALISADTLESVKISADGRTYEIKVDTAEDSYRFGKKKVEKEEFAALYQSISGIMLVSEADPEKSGREEEPRLSVTFCRNTGDAPEVCVSYHPYDEEFDSVEINGKEQFLVRKEDVEDLIGQIEAAF